MPNKSKKKFQSYMKPVARRVTIQKPAQNKTVLPAKTIEGGFVRINDSTIRKVYK